MQSSRIVNYLLRLPSAASSFSTSAYRLPESLIDFKFVRSSGPGGQHVNKVSTACEARIDLNRVDIPAAAKERLIDQQKNRINAKLELVVESQEERSQLRNREKCKEKIQFIIDKALVEPKHRVIQMAPPEKTKEKWREEKRLRKEVKEGRKKFKDFDDY